MLFNQQAVKVLLRNFNRFFNFNKKSVFNVSHKIKTTQPARQGIVTFNFLTSSQTVHSCEIYKLHLSKLLPLGNISNNYSTKSD
jgi:hypothetical protein